MECHAMKKALTIIAAICTVGTVGAERNAFFGDLHVHTKFSFDAFSFATRGSPDDAYRFAAGGTLTHPAGFEVRLDEPLDFYAVTDHAAYLGALLAFSDPEHPLHEEATELGILDAATVAARGGYHPQARPFMDAHVKDYSRASAWAEIVAAANRHYRPGEFTTLIAYEYTPSRDGGNLHRNVIFAGSDVPDDIFGRLDSANPEDLWRWMDAQRERGSDVLAIPHNSNGSDGWMFQDVQFDGSAIDADYADLRMRNEPLVEITQVKGTSDTHPFLSPNDEWADFEIFPYRVGQWGKSRPDGSYVRAAYLTGLVLEERAGVNPYRFGIVAASDTHNAGTRFDEETFAGKVGVHDAFAPRRGSVPVGEYDGLPTYRHVYRTHYSASGIAGVWAEENTRESIFAAFRRKETFGTSGTRIRLRLFAGHDLPADLHERRDMAAGVDGVPQGGDLAARDAAPSLAVQALADPGAAPLQRLQVIKGWVEDGQRHERVFDIACSDGLAVEPQTHRCPDNGATVDLATCAISADVGASQLGATWTDPTWDGAPHVFYYARVLENPTCRWSTWDAIRAGVPTRLGFPETIQERAWTSPVWVRGE